MWLRAVMPDVPTFESLSAALRSESACCVRTRGLSPCVMVCAERLEVVWNEPALAMLNSIMALEHVEELPDPMQDDYVPLSA